MLLFSLSAPVVSKFAESIRFKTHQVNCPRKAYFQLEMHQKRFAPSEPPRELQCSPRPLPQWGAASWQRKQSWIGKEESNGDRRGRAKGLGVKGEGGKEGWREGRMGGEDVRKGRLTGNLSRPLTHSLGPPLFIYLFVCFGSVTKII